mgnify:FL=1
MGKINLIESSSTVFPLLLAAVDIFEKGDPGYDEVINWAKATIVVMDKFFETNGDIHNKITDSYKYLKMFLQSRVDEANLATEAKQ